MKHPHSPQSTPELFKKEQQALWNGQRRREQGRAAPHGEEQPLHRLVIAQDHEHGSGLSYAVKRIYTYNNTEILIGRICSTSNEWAFVTIYSAVIRWPELELITAKLKWLNQTYRHEAPNLCAPR